MLLGPGRHRHVPRVVLPGPRPLSPPSRLQVNPKLKALPPLPHSSSFISDHPLSLTPAAWHTRVQSTLLVCAYDACACVLLCLGIDSLA